MTDDRVDNGHDFEYDEAHDALATAAKAVATMLG